MEKNVKEIVAEAERLDIKDKGVLALSEVLFDKNMVDQIPKFRPLFLRVSSIVCVFNHKMFLYATRPSTLLNKPPLLEQVAVKLMKTFCKLKIC